MSTGLGFSAYGLSVFGYPSDDPVSLEPAKVGAARKMHFPTRRYVVADDGGFEAMDEIAQRVMLTIAFAVKLPAFITPQGEAELEQAVRTELANAGMLDPRDPDIDLESVDVSHDQHQIQFIGARYKNLRTGTYQYVSPR